MRPQLNGYKREFSMPENFHIQVPPRHQLPNANKHKRMNALSDNCCSPEREDEVNTTTVSPAQRNSVADSLLSKHNGWITIDDENRDRKQAPETF